jgi:hypothetical protein
MINGSSGVWGEKLFESEEKQYNDKRSERTPRVFPMRLCRKGAVFLSESDFGTFFTKSTEKKGEDVREGWEVRFLHSQE